MCLCSVCSVLIKHITFYKSMDNKSTNLDILHLMTLLFIMLLTFNFQFILFFLNTKFENNIYMLC